MVRPRIIEMARKQFFLVVDTETTVRDTVADFGAVVIDRKGEIFTQCAVMVRDHFDTSELFYTGLTGFWGKVSAERRKAKYNEMLLQGSRMLASVAAINRWLEKVSGKYSPILTAYNLAFDTDKCEKTGIDLNTFAERFCLWSAASATICQTKAYKNFVVANHLFNSPTDKGNMTFKTDAESVAGFLNGQMVKEPHTAIEDAIQFEVPILRAIISKRKWRSQIQSYDWKSFQVKNHFCAR